MPKIAGIVLTTVGALLIVLALLLFCYNQNEDDTAGREAESLLTEVLAAIETATPQASIGPLPTGSDGETVAETETELPMIQIDGENYIGYLTIPDLQLQLPVMADWDYDRLKKAPCRQFGSVDTDDLVIAAHNYKNHFGKLGTLTVGASLSFTDMTGTKHSYTVTNITTLPEDAVDAVQNSGHDLVLYTCTLTGTTRVAVFCDRENGEE